MSLKNFFSGNELVQKVNEEDGVILSNSKK
jgi:hypothetical protein